MTKKNGLQAQLRIYLIRKKEAKASGKSLKRINQTIKNLRKRIAYIEKQDQYMDKVVEALKYIFYFKGITTCHYLPRHLFCKYVLEHTKIRHWRISEYVDMNDKYAARARKSVTKKIARDKDIKNYWLLLKREMSYLK